MARNRTSSFWLLLWGALVFLGLRPVAGIERALDALLVPLRFAAELGSPVAALRADEVTAAERALAQRAEGEALEGAEALLRLAERALPSAPELRGGRRFLPAAVIARPSKDECWVAWPEPTEVPPGTPVVCGDAFVGRVVEARAGSTTRARVELVTHAWFRVGAEVRGGTDSEGPTYLTVGGVRVPRSRAEPRTVRLAAHQPSSSRIFDGIATVHELFADADQGAALAEGFRLGRLRREGERDDFWIEPELDYLDGLFHVALVLAADGSAPAPVPARPVLRDGQWLATRALTFGDPSPWRSALKLPLGRGDGVRAGAAVTSVGARLVGRVLRPAAATSDVALLSDPGFSLVAIACPEGGGEPRVLGRLTTLGRGPQDAVRLRWWVRVPLEIEGPGADSVAARIFTGPGDPGLPGGLFLGTAHLPRRAAAGEERELLLDPGFEPEGVRQLFVRCEAEEGRP